VASTARRGFWNLIRAFLILRQQWCRATRRSLPARHILEVEVPAALFQKRRIPLVTLRTLGRGGLIADASVRWIALAKGFSSLEISPDSVPMHSIYPMAIYPMAGNPRLSTAGVVAAPPLSI
jgi:hypothetical protein